MKRKKAKVTKRATRSRAVTLETLANLLEVIESEYRGDPTSAGVVLARINDGRFYGSVCRYAEKFGEGRRVVVTAKADTLGEVVRSLGRRVLDRAGTVRRLQEAIADVDYEPEDFWG
jgi:hypothetical protein